MTILLRWNRQWGCALGRDRVLLVVASWCCGGLWWFVVAAVVAVQAMLLLGHGAVVSRRAVAPADDGAAEIGDWLLTAAFVVFTAVTVPLMMIDAMTMVLPDRIIAPAGVAVSGLVAAADVIASNRCGAWWAGLGSFMSVAVFVALAIPGWMGWGDVKLAGVIGVMLGQFGPGLLVLGWCAAFGFGGVVAIFVRRSRAGGGSFAFGPWMLAGAWVAFGLR